MRGSKCLLALVGVGLLAAGCGTRPAPSRGAEPVVAAASSTVGKTARVVITIGMRARGMSVSFTESGVFDFAHKRGKLFMTLGRRGVGFTEIFLPPKVYLHAPGAKLPRGKSWVVADVGSARKLSSLAGPFALDADPASLLSALTAISANVTQTGQATIRGIRVTGYRLTIDPAKAARRLPASHRRGLLGLADVLGRRRVPVEVWVDQQGLVRRVRVVIPGPGHGLATSGGHPARVRFTLTVDYYGFGVPVVVKAPPAAEVASMGQVIRSRAASGSGHGFGTGPPPPASGTLSPAQAAAADRVVREFWAALSSMDFAALRHTVLAGEWRCASAIPRSVKFTVRSLRILSARPDGPGHAAVLFIVRARESIDGHSMLLLPRRVQWLAVTRAGGRWYVDLGRSAGMLASPCG